MAATAITTCISILWYEMTLLFISNNCISAIPIISLVVNRNFFTKTEHIVISTNEKFDPIYIQQMIDTAIDRYFANNVDTMQSMIKQSIDRYDASRTVLNGDDVRIMINTAMDKYDRDKPDHMIAIDDKIQTMIKMAIDRYDSEKTVQPCDQLVQSMITIAIDKYDATRIDNIEAMIKRAIDKYDSDKTGIADFALESSGMIDIII